MKVPGHAAFPPLILFDLFLFHFVMLFSLKFSQSSLPALPLGFSFLPWFPLLPIYFLAQSVHLWCPQACEGPAAFCEGWRTCVYTAFLFNVQGLPLLASLHAATTGRSC